MAVTGQIDANLVFNQLAPSVREHLVPFPPIEAIQEHAIAVETAEHLCRISLKYGIGSFTPQVNLDPARCGLVIALDRLDTWEIRTSIDKCHAGRKVPGRLVLVAKSGRKFEALCSFCGFCHGPVPMQKRYPLPKYLPFYFDVKYFYIKIL